VLDQLLDGRGRPLDDLAGGNAVDGAFGEAADGQELAPRYSRVRRLPSSTAGWPKGSTSQSLAAISVSSVKCIMREPIARSSRSATRRSMRTGRPLPVSTCALA